MPVTDKKLSNALEDCIAWGIAQRRITDGRKGTAAQYRSTFRAFLAVCDPRAEREHPDRRLTGCYVRDLDASYMTAFFGSLKCSAGQAGNHLSRLKSFSDYCVVMGYFSSEKASRLLQGFTRPRVVKTAKTRVKATDFTLVLDKAAERCEQDRALIAFGLYTGGRRSELTCLRLGAIHPDEWRIEWYASKTGKFDEDAVIGAALRPHLDRWLAYYMGQTGFEGTAEAFCRAHPDWYLLPKREYKGRVRGGDGQVTDGRKYKLIPTAPWSGHLEEIVRAVLIMAGIRFAKRTGMHALRRSAARALYEHLALKVGNDEALLMVQTFLRHDNLRSTMLYIGIDGARDRLNEILASDADIFAPPTSPEPPSGNVVAFPSGSRMAAAARTAGG
jgi:integrase